MEESESQLQQNFINLLKNIGYEYVEIKNENELISNFKNQLKLFNKGINFNFDDVLSYLYQEDKNSKFDKLRKSYNGIKFIDFSDFSSNIFQVTQEVNVVGEYTNRYDVTILINGLPLVQIELKKSGVELINAFNQIQRYYNHSYSGLFDLTQIYVISNKVNTKYFFNDSNFNYDKTYHWFDNVDLVSFTNSFFQKDTLMSILSNFIFKDSLSDNYIMLKPYQINSFKKVFKNIDKKENGYLWFAPNSGKSTTSYKLAEILCSNYQVIYIISDVSFKYPPKFLVNSKKEFLHAINNQNLIISNINIILALTDEELADIKNNQYIFILNDYEKNTERYNPIHLTEMFNNALFYCFTSAPLFDENRIFDLTTKAIFKNQIFTYSLNDSLSDSINLPIEVSYVDDENLTENFNLSSPVRIKKISDYILENHSVSKALLITSSNEDLIKYYEYLKKSDLRIVPVLRHGSEDIFNSKPMRDYFEAYIKEYNHNFGAGILHKKVVDNTKISQEFEEDVIKRFKNDEIDLVILDKSIFFDEFRINILNDLKNPLLDTVYLDCELKYGNLFEALCLTNGNWDNKNHSNVILFRNLKENIKKAMGLFLREEYKNNHIFKDYNFYLNQYNDLLSKMNDVKQFMENFNKLSDYYNILKLFKQHSFTTSQHDEFNFYKDKFEHETYKFNSSKKIITEYEPKLLDYYIIDRDYISDSDDEELNMQDVQSDETNNILNLSKIDNSHHVNNFTDETANILSLKNIDKSNNIKIVNNNQDLSKTVNVTNEYHIHIGGDKISQNDNQRRILDLNSLMLNNNQEDSDLVKICPRCNKKYAEEYNFCSKHDERIDLVYISDLVKVCKVCGRRYPKEYNYCVEGDSDEPLTVDIQSIETRPNDFYNIYSYSNHLNEISQLLSATNIEKLHDFNLTEMEFNSIINDIKDTYKRILDYIISEYNIDVDSLDTLNTILLFSKSFVKTDFKEGGGDLGHFEFNEIFIDDRATDALQITTIIHELSHFLMAEILEQIVSKLLETDKTDAVEAFVSYTLVKNSLNYLIDEYCAHTVEGRFAVLGYQDYGSYKSALGYFIDEYSEEHVEIANEIGNTFANYIKQIVESFIDDNLRKKIKMEFSKINDVPKYSELKYETNKYLEWQGFSNAIQIMLTGKIEEFINNPKDMEQLKSYAIKFKINNEG